MRAINKKTLKHTKIYTDSLKIGLHKVLSHTKIDFTKSQESFAKDCSRTTLH